MEHITIVGTEENLLVLATEAGERFALPIDDVLHAEIRRAQRSSRTAPLAASPREIQQHIRSGLSASETAELLGVDREVVERFEGPVLAEREHIVSQALSVSVALGNEIEPDAQPTFGEAVRARLSDLAASKERWVSWRDDEGWVVKLEFAAEDIQHDARWRFDPRRSALTAINSDAEKLSRPGPLPEGLIPRLRALDSERTSPLKDTSRFDSGAFGPRKLPAAPVDDNVNAAASETEPERSDPAVQEAATKRAPHHSAPSSDTADLLEALRRRRGQRDSDTEADGNELRTTPRWPISVINDEPVDGTDDTAGDSAPEAPVADEEQHEQLGQPQLSESLFGDVDNGPVDTTHEPAPESEPLEANSATGDQQEGSRQTSTSRRRRRELPSWDEIVFGARTEE
ncbi:septation protein SepH [Microbacterium sp. YY-01]|uniref:septation protein SepH n=1 Tax=Microbacterium sp. YY-01 TaxID=3421634 RepID=UPI003D17E097